MPDYLNGDAIAAADLGSGKVQLMEWLGKHGQDVTRPPLDKVINHLKEQGVQKFAAIGYCFGASLAKLVSPTSADFVCSLLRSACLPAVQAPAT